MMAVRAATKMKIVMIMIMIGCGFLLTRWELHITR